jgi:hypothetical protein
VSSSSQKEGPTPIEAVRAEALFASTVQASEAPAGDRVRDAVTATLTRHGEVGCAVQVAGEFGEHPETAAARMGWCLRTVRATFGPR